MAVNDVIAAKLELLSRYLERLRHIVPPSRAVLEGNWERQKAVERILQVMVEVVIDVADRLISLRGLPPSATAASSLERLAELGILKDAARYRDLVRFRDFIVHRYEDVDLSIVFGILSRHLGDFEEFAREVRSNVS